MRILSKILKSILKWRPNKAYHHLIIINIICFALQYLIPEDFIVNHLASYGMFSDKFEVQQIITSMFIHGSNLHLIVNMIVLLSLGLELEKSIMPSKQFLALYILSGIGSFIVSSFFVDVYTPSIGASGAIYGLLGASIVLIPNRKFYILIFPFKGFKAKYILSIALVLELVLGLINTGSNIGHMAHFGGGLTGLILALFAFNKYKELK